MGQDTITMADLTQGPREGVRFLGKTLSYSPEESLRVGIGTYEKEGFLVERFPFAGSLYLFLLDKQDRRILDCLIKERQNSFHYFGDGELSLDGGPFAYYIVEFTTDSTGEALRYLGVYEIDASRKKFQAAAYTELLEMPPAQQ